MKEACNTNETKIKYALFGSLFAIIAAMLNGTVGIFSRTGFIGGLDHSSIAFWRCLIAFLIVSVILSCKKNGFEEIKKYKGVSMRLALCSFFGVFMLYHFETLAFRLAKIPLVSMIEISGGLATLVIGVILLREKVTVLQILAMAATVSGCFLIIKSDVSGGSAWSGVAYSLLAGISYSLFLFLFLFLFLWKAFNLYSCLASLWWFFLFGCLYLFFPYFYAGAEIPVITDLPILLALGGLPSFGGFFFTILALKHIEAHKVQILEISEPLFTSIFAFVLFNELLGRLGIVGSLIILSGMLLITLESSGLIRGNTLWDSK